MSAHIGTARIRVKSPTSGRLSTSSTTFARNSEAIRPQTTSGCSWNSSGPGWMLSASSSASSTAVVPEPGTPSDSIGTSAPPAAALLPASGAATPRGSPWPKLSSLLESRFSVV